MANSITHASLPYPVRKARYSVEMGFVVSAGTLTDPTTPDTEYSVDGGASFADTAEEITTGGGNGAGYLTLTGAELDNPSVILAFKSANCVTRLRTLRPRNLAIVGSGTLSAGSAGGGTLGTLLAYDVTGCFVRTTGGTGGGGTGGANNQARRIITYNTSTGAFTVSPNWETTPDNTTTYDVLLPEGVTIGMLRTVNPITAGRSIDLDANGRALLQPTQTGVTIPTVTTLAGHTPQTGDAFARLGAPAGASIAADIASNKADLTTLLGRITAARAGYWDNLNVGGAVASQADINAINQSASRRVILATVGQYERPESGSTVYTIEARTYSDDGVPMDATGTPTLAATGQTTGDLAANLGSITNPAVGVYRWQYTVANSATLEPVRFDFSAVVDGDTIPMSVYTQVCDFVAATFTTADRTKLEAIHGKLPSKNYLTGTANSDGDIQLNEATGTLQDVTLAASQPNYAPLKASDYKSPVAATGTVTAVTTQFEFQTGLTQANSFWKDHPLRFTSGNNVGAVRVIRSYDQANGTIYLTNGDGFPLTIQVGDTFEILSDHIHSIADIAGETTAEVLGDTSSWPANSIGNRVQGSAQATVLTSLAAIFAGMTSLPNWLRRLARKDAGTADMGTAQTEINTGGTSTFAGTTDSLEAIRDASGGGGGGGGGPVSASVVVPAATARAVLQGDTIGVTRGDTLRVSLTDLGDISGRQKLWFTVKQSKEAGDSAAIIQIEESGGLTLLNGAAPNSSAWGTMTVVDANAGDVDIVLYASATKLLSKASGLIWDVKQSLGSNPDDATTQSEGKMNVELNVTQATS